MRSLACEERSAECAVRHYTSPHFIAGRLGPCRASCRGAGERVHGATRTAPLPAGRHRLASRGQLP